MTKQLKNHKPEGNRRFFCTSVKDNSTSGSPSGGFNLSEKIEMFPNHIHVKDVKEFIKDTLKDMKEVEKDLLKNTLNRKTINRQQKILSRMLESQRSLEKREYSEKRKAEQSKKYSIEEPGEQESKVLSKKEIEEAMQAALKQGFHKDYQKMIKIYFQLAK